MKNRNLARIGAALLATALFCACAAPLFAALSHARQEGNAELVRLLEGGATSAANAPKPPTKYVGRIGPYPVTFFLDVRVGVGEKAGHYFYDERPQSVFSLEMVKNEGNLGGFHEVILHEYTPRGMQSGVFTGRVLTRGDGFSGAFVNSRGQSFPFELREAGN